MKIHVYGNTLNIGYDLTMQLRNQGIDAELFLDDTSKFNQDFPWWDDKSINKDNLPNWLHYYKTFPFFLFPNKQTKQLIKDFGNCDVALVSCWGPILAMKAKVPFVFISVGSDLNSLSYEHELKSLQSNSLTLKGKISKIAKLLTFIPLQKKALQKYASFIIIGMGYQFNSYIKKFKLENKTLKMPHPKDVLGYGIANDIEVYGKYKKYELVFFMFSRHTWSSVWNDLKGNDKFIRAFARFVKTHNPNVKFYLPKKGIDIKKSEALINELGINSYVEWFNDMPKYELKKIQAMPNVVMVDNFWHDQWFKRFPLDITPKVGFGFGGIESLASKAMLLTAFSDDEFYGNTKPPILYAFTEDEIFNRLEEVYFMPKEDREVMRQAGYDFVVKWHEQKNVIYKHIDLLKVVYNQNK